MVILEWISQKKINDKKMPILDNEKIRDKNISPSMKSRRTCLEKLSEGVNLRDYIDILFRRKWIVISCLLVSVVTVAISSFMMEKVYRTRTSIEIVPFHIIDGLPIANFPDSRLPSRLAEGVVIITIIGITQRQSLRISIEEITKVGDNIIGTVVNRVESKSKFGYRYYYYYNNGDTHDQEKGRLTSPGS